MIDFPRVVNRLVIMNAGYLLPSLLVAAGLALTAGTQAQNRAAVPPGPTIWDGVYSKAQAERGLRVYRESCTYCHHDDLLGGEDLPVIPPALVGIAFFERWSGATVGKLFRVTSETMPWRRASLSPQAYADVVSYLLQENGAPAGSIELAPDAAALDRIAIPSEPPGKPAQ